MNKKIKPTVYSILLEDKHARCNDNYLIIRVVQRLEPFLARSKFIDLRFSKLSMESITRARRQFFREYPELKPKKMSSSSQCIEMQK